jgi:hypothetical protein
MGLGFINLKIWEFENLKMGGLLHSIFKSSNSQIPEFSNLQIPKFSN